MSEPAPLRAREATESDAGPLLRWRNDPVTRAWSRNPDPVGAADHRRWLRAACESRTRLLLVVERDGEPVGTVRLDRVRAGEWEVSITVAPEHRGRGLGGPILAAGEAELAGRVRTATLLANVHRDNATSLALFRRAGYRERPDLGSDGPFVWLAKVL